MNGFLEGIDSNIVKISKNSRNMVFYHLDLASFKKIACKRSSIHDSNKCVFYHGRSDHIRDLATHNYSSIICMDKRCDHLNCGKSKNYLEKLYHLNFYKKKLCIDYYIKGDCNYGSYCALAHDLRELKIPLLNFYKVDLDFLLFKFKTVFCPFNLFEHDKFTCVYAHNYQDFRRKNCQSLVPKLCKFWDLKKRVESYEEGCADGFNCLYCHGWKELDYHHSQLKKKMCKKGWKCERKELCSYFHSKEDQCIESNNNEEFFYSVEKNLPLQNEAESARWYLEIKSKRPVSFYC